MSLVRKNFHESPGACRNSAGALYDQRSVLADYKFISAQLQAWLVFVSELDHYHAAALSVSARTMRSSATPLCSCSGVQ